MAPATRTFRIFASSTSGVGGGVWGAPTAVLPIPLLGRHFAVEMGSLTAKMSQPWDRR